MTTIRRTLTTLAVAFGAIASAHATTIITTQTVFGTIPTFTSATSTGTVAQFDAAAVNLAIQAACLGGHTCSALTFLQTDFSITMKTLGTVVLANSSGGPLTAKSVAGVADITMTDALGVFAPEIISSFPAANVKVNAGSSATKTGSGSSTETGTINMVNGNFSYTGPATFSGNTVTDLSVSLASLNALYKGAGVVNFDLTLDGSVTSNLPSFVTITTNSEQVNGTAAGTNPSILQVQYTYSYEDTINSGVPEPTTLVLFGSALLGLGLLRKRAPRS